MAGHVRLTAGLVALLGLAACNNATNGGTGGADLCMPFAPTTAAAGGPAGAPAVAPPISADPSAGVEDCLHRWGYALAHSTDDAQHVANAVVAACGPSISRWNQTALAGGGGPAPEAPSLLNGQQTTPLTEHYLFAQGRALFYVVQARAGHCASPPMKDGAPTGIAR